MAAELAQYNDFTHPFNPEGPSQSFELLAEQQAQNFQLPPHTFDNRPQVGGIVIDPAGCVDHDDAIFAQATKTGYFIAVTISAVGEFIEYNSAIDRLASIRGESRYRRNVAVGPLLPRRLSENIFSLNEDHLCPTITIAFETNQQMDILNVQVAKTSYRSPQNVTYEEAFEAMQQSAHPDHDMLVAAAEIADNLERKRLRRHLATEPVVITEATPHKVVEECMLLANMAMAKWCEDNNVSVLYRNHPNRVGMSGVPKTAAYYAPFNTGHKALRADAYMQVTSPLRRAPDFQAIREICFLLGNVTSQTTEADLLNLALYANRANSEKKGRRVS